ncbi:MAG TPA: ATP-binding protein, partial [Myxococcota bacterium]
AAERMHRMVLDVLDVSRSEGELPLQRSLVDVHELLLLAEAQFATRAQLSDVTLHIADGAPLIAPLDRELLQRVLDNLIDNAIKYGHRRIDVSAGRLDDDTGGSIEIVVADDGEGIPLEDRRRIFVMGQRLAMHAARETASSRGLGLCFCAMAVAAHGGTIVVDDNIPSGSRFVLRLPIVG